MRRVDRSREGLWDDLAKDGKVNPLFSFQSKLMSAAETLLDELERRQDEVLTALDELDVKINAVIENWLGTKTSAEPKTAVADAA